MKQLIFIFIALLTVSCNAQNNLKNSTKKSKTVDEKHPPALQDTVQIGFFRDAESSTPNLTEISEQVFESINYKESLDTTVFVKRNKQGFSISTGYGELHYESRKSDQTLKLPRHGSIFLYEYYGYYVPNQFYEIFMHETSMEYETGEFYLIDSLTTTIYNIVGTGDAGIENPIWSAEGSQLAYCANDSYGMIGLLAYEQEAPLKERFTEVKFWDFDKKTAIISLKWFDNKTLSIKTRNKNTQEIRYYTFPIE